MKRVASVVAGCSLIATAQYAQAAPVHRMAARHPFHATATLQKKLSTDTEKVYCTSGPTTFAHGDGGVITFDKFCATFRESADKRLGYTVSTNVIGINHHVHWSMDQIFYMKASPSQRLDDPVALGGASANCARLPFPVTWSGQKDYPTGHPSMLNNAADSATFEWTWYNDDDSLCSAVKSQGAAKRH